MLHCNLLVLGWSNLAHWFDPRGSLYFFKIKRNHEETNRTEKRNYKDQL